MGDNRRRSVEGTAEFLLQELYRRTMRSHRIGGEQTTQFVAALELDHSRQSPSIPLGGRKVGNRSTA
jgi:hypothetical protein